MSIHTLTRDPAGAVSSYPPDAPVIVLGHGGGSAYWPRTHPLAQWALQLVPIVYSLQLPFHGSDAVREIDLPFSTDAEKRLVVQSRLVRPIEEALVEVLRGRYVIFVTYSTSAICLLKLFPRLRTRASLHPLSMLLCIGSALCIGEASQQLIQHFWRTESYESNPGKLASMQRLHAQRQSNGDKHVSSSPQASDRQVEVDDQSWRNCVRIIHFATGRADSGLFTTRDEWKGLLAAPVLSYQQRQQKAAQVAAANSTSSAAALAAAVQRPCASLQPNYIFFIQGSSDEPFPPSECIISPLRVVQSSLQHHQSQRDLVVERVRLVEDASHFGYFAPASKGGSLEGVVDRLKQLVEQYGEHGLLRPWSSQGGKQTASLPARTAPAASSSASPSSSFASPPCYAAEFEAHDQAAAGVNAVAGAPSAGRMARARL